MPALLAIRKLADKSVERVYRYDPDTGDRYVADPETGEPSPYPCVGIAIEGEAPVTCNVPTSTAQRLVLEGHATLTNPRLVQRPGGPKSDPWRVIHTFIHGDTFVLKAVGGDVTYRVTSNPDKWPDEKRGDDLGFGGEVRWYYELELVSG